MNLKPLALLPLLFLGAHAMADTDATTLDTDKQKLSYIFGIQVGQNMVAEGVVLEMDAFTAGVADMFAGKPPQLNQEEAGRVIGEFQQKKAAEIAKIMNEKQQESQAFMEENAKKEGVITTASGLQYRIITEGDGATPTAEDTVIAHYKGTLLDGTVFDSSHDRGEPATFAVTGVIQGWQEVLQLMQEGDKWEVVIPGGLAYGPVGAGRGSPIGPNETLIFEIELIAITK